MIQLRRFDWIVHPDVPSPLTEWDVELAGNDAFAVLPSLGSLVPGWVLIVPRRRVYNLRQLSAHERTRLRQLANSVRPVLQRFASKVFEFEHGGAYGGSPMGCGVDQAHLHVVPLRFDLLEEVRKASTNLAWTRAMGTKDPWSSIPGGVEYILVNSPAKNAIFAVVEAPDSQWVRKVIASKLCAGGAWDYRSAPGLDNIRATIAVFRTAVAQKTMVE